jgi:high-affinity Fe2+/Pb2+ permease
MNQWLDIVVNSAKSGVGAGVIAGIVAGIVAGFRVYRQFSRSNGKVKSRTTKE